MFNVKGEPEIIVNWCSKLAVAILIAIVGGYMYAILGDISVYQCLLLVIAIILLCSGLGLLVGIIFGKAAEKQLLDDLEYRAEIAIKRKELALKEQELKDNEAFRAQELALREKELKENFARKEQELKENFAHKEQELKENFILREQAQNAEREIRLRELEIKAKRIALEEQWLSAQEAKFKASANHVDSD